MPLYVPLKRDALLRLRQLAEQERRRPQDQAAVLLERALEQEQVPAECVVAGAAPGEAADAGG